MIKILIISLLVISCGRKGRNASIQKTSNINTAIAARDYQYIISLSKTVEFKSTVNTTTNPLMDLFLNFDGVATEEEEKARLQAIESLIANQNFDMNFVSPDDQSTCLSIAVLNNDVNGVKILLKHNVKTNLLYGPFKRSALQLAIEAKHNKIAELLYPKTKLELKDSEGLDHQALAKKIENTDYLLTIKEKSN